MRSNRQYSNRHGALEHRLVHGLAGARIDDRAAVHDREMVAQLAREVEILLDQHDRDLSEIAQIGDGAADILDDRGLNALGGFIEQEKLWPHDERPADGELLLLATGTLTATPAQRPVEDREQ